MSKQAAIPISWHMLDPEMCLSCQKMMWNGRMKYCNMFQGEDPAKAIPRVKKFAANQFSTAELQK